MSCLAASPTDRRPAPAPPPAAATTDVSLFVVDDDAFMREMLEAVFVRAGIPVRTFASARDLLALADLGSRCLLLLDVQMPDMSGLELQALLHARRIDVPVMFLTAAADVPMAVAAMRAGAVDFLEKPVGSELLLTRVRLAIGRLGGAGRAAPAGFAQRLGSLTPREHEVLALMVTGATSKRMARVLGGSFRTIEIHRSRVMSKMGAASLAELVRMKVEAVDRG